MCRKKIAVKASVEGDSVNTKMVANNVKCPEITSVKWVNINTNREKTETRYEKKVGILIDTIDASSLYLFVIIESKEWVKSFVTIEYITEVKTKKNEKTTKESTLLIITPQSEWAIDTAIETNMEMTAYIISDTRKEWTANTLGSIAEVVTGKGSNNFQGIGMTRDFHNERANSEITTVFTKAGSKAKKIKLKEKKIVIVLDPGHGFDTGFTGTQCRSYRYYEKGEKGEPDKTKINHAKASDLPDYVLSDIDKWIIRWTNDHTIKKEEQEWFYVIDVVLYLKEILEEQLEYYVIMTREVEVEGKIRNQIEGKDVFDNRKAVANNNDADYFISIHCDGQGSDPTKEDINSKNNKYKISGCFIVIPEGEKYTNSKGQDTELSRELGKDIMKHYNIVPHDPQPIQKPNGTKSVFTKDNYTQRRIIIELGRMTNPFDTQRLYAKGAQEKVAKQIADGITYNIKNSYGK